MKLTEAREKAGLKQKDVADKLKKSVQTISNWETGRQQIDRANLLLLALLYGVSINDLDLPDVKG